jgi:hypothetical protein
VISDERGGTRLSDHIHLRAAKYALSKNIPTTGPLNRRSLHYAPPDFLSRFVALRICMRLSLRRAAQVDVASSAK